MRVYLKRSHTLAKHEIFSPVVPIAGCAGHVTFVCAKVVSREIYLDLADSVVSPHRPLLSQPDNSHVNN